MIRLSIIIPFYNVEPYIGQCLDSVYQQDIPEEEYEVICVNDASPDNSREIVKEYQKKHKNLILVEHEVNKKLGAARNTGRKIAQGKYIWHMDSDDKIEPNCLKTLLSICETKQLDVLEFGFIDWYPDKIVSCREWEPARKNGIMTGQEYINAHFLQRFGLICPIWRRVYRREFLNVNNILSPPINMGEDEPFAIQVFATAQRVAFEPQDWYCHRINKASLVGENMQSWSAQKWYEASMVCPYYVHHVYQLVRPIISSDIRKAIEDLIAYDILYFDTFKAKFSHEASKGFWKLCRANTLRNLYMFRYMSRKKRYAYIRSLLIN